MRSESHCARLVLCRLQFVVPLATGLRTSSSSTLSAQSIMSITPLDRLLFAQGGLCFFYSSPLQKENASVEHLDAKANGGTNSDKNCVACCREINSLLGSTSLKEKIRVILNQNGKFACPKRASSQSKSAAKTVCPPPAEATDHYSTVVTSLEKRGDSRPKKVESLKNLIRSITANAKGSLTEAELDSLLHQLECSDKVQVHGTMVNYSF